MISASVWAAFWARASESPKVGYVLYLSLGVIMRHDDGILLLAHAAYFGLQVSPCRYGLIGIALLLPF